MSKLAEKIAKRLKSELGIEVEPVIERSYTRTFDAGEARFYMPLVDKSRVPDFIRFEERASDIAKASKLGTYNSDRFTMFHPDVFDSVVVEKY